MEKYDLKNVPSEDLEKELKRRKDLLENKKDLSSIPIEYLISEWAKRQKEFSNATTDFDNFISQEKHKKIVVDIPKEYTPPFQFPKIFFNAIKTPDGTVLSSRHVHDFVTHEDSKTGKRYGVDGGPDYLRRIGDVNECEDLSITSDSSFEEIRVKFHWGSFGKNGDQKKVDRRLSELSSSHLEAILKNINFPHDSTFKKWFEQEVDYRKQKNIFVDEY